MTTPVPHAMLRPKLVRVIRLFTGCVILASCDSPAAISEATFGVAVEQAEGVLEGQFIVRFDEAVDQSGLLAQELSDEYNAELLYVYERVFKGVLLRVDNQVADRIRRHSGVARVKPDTRGIRVTTQYPAGWALGRIDDRDTTDFSFDYYFDGSNVDLYIVDSGVADLSDYSARLADGWAIDSQDPHVDCVAPYGHGTLVASAAASAAYGSAKGATIVPVRVHDGSCEFTEGTTVAGLDWIVGEASGPSVVNISLRWADNLFCCGDLHDAVDELLETDIAVVAGAGNDTANACDYSPGNFAGVITVAASTQADARAVSSNYGSCVALFAPGAGIPVYQKSGSTGLLFDGTSLASPFVAGVAAQVLEQEFFGSPSFVKQVITSTATVNEISNAGSGSPNLFLFSLHPYMYLDGPSQLTSPGNATWHAKRWGGSGSYSYVWRESMGGGVYDTLGTSSSYTRLIDSGECYTFIMELIVDFGGGLSDSDVKQVWVESPPCPEQPGLTRRQTRVRADRQ